MGNKQCKEPAINVNFVKKFVECGEAFLDDACGILSCLHPLHAVFKDAKEAIENDQALVHVHLDPDTSVEIDIAAGSTVDEAINAMISGANNINEEGIGFFTMPIAETAASNADTTALALITTFLVTSQGNFPSAAASINRTNMPQLYGNYSAAGGDVDQQVKIALSINEAMKTILFPNKVADLDYDKFLFVSTENPDNKLMQGKLINLIDGCVLDADEDGPECIPPGLYIRPPEKRKCKKQRCQCPAADNFQQRMWQHGASSSNNCSCNGSAAASSLNDNCGGCSKRNERSASVACKPIIIGPESDPYLLPFKLAGIDLFSQNRYKDPRDEFVSRFR